MRPIVDFLLNDWLNVASLTERERFADHSAETFAQVLNTCERIAREKYAPFNRLVDTEEPRFDGEKVHLPQATHDAWKAYAESGMLSAAQSYDIGGMQLPYTVEAAANGFFAKASVSIGAGMLTTGNANLFPKKISFRVGGVIAGLIGVVICPWWLMDEISGILVFVSGLLGPVLGILLCDYFLVRKRTLILADLYRENGPHAGVSKPALIALIAGVLVALIGYWVKPLEALYQLSWFTGFIVSFVVYAVLKRWDATRATARTSS